MDKAPAKNMEEDKVCQEIAWRERMQTDLYYSIERNDPVTLRKVLKAGYDPNLVFEGLDPMGRPLCWYPLHFCCEKGREECARSLIAAGADPDVGDRWGVTPLMYAVQREWHNMVELMIDSGASIDLQDSKGRTALHLAVECSDTKCIELLCKAGAKVHVLDQMGRSPLWVCVTKNGRVDHLKAILPHSLIDWPDKRDRRTPLQEAISYADVDRLEYVRLLINAGADIHNRDAANMNTMLNLIYTARRRVGGETDDIYAVALILLEAGYNLNEVPSRIRWQKSGVTPIKMAAEQGLTELVELFLNRGANPDIADDNGVTPLLVATSENRQATVLALLRSNCNLELAGDIKIDYVYCNVTPLHCAIVKGHMNIARMLILAGASVKTEKYLYSGGFGGSPGGFEVPPALVADCEFWLWLGELACNPLTLFNTAVKTIRTALGFGLNAKLEQLPLPASLRRCISLNELIDCTYM